MTQLTMFVDVSFDDERPLPEILARQYGFALQSQYSGEGVRMWAVQDWIAGVSNTHDAKKVSERWRDMKRKSQSRDNNPTLDQSSENNRTLKRRNKPSYATIPASQIAEHVRKLPYVASDGKTYQRDYGDADMLYQVAQALNSNSELSEKIRRYLAKAGVLADEIRRDPSKAAELAAAGYKKRGLSDQWIEQRLGGVVARKALTGAISAAVSEALTGRDYAHATDTLYMGLFDRTARALRKDMGLPDGANPREHQSAEALAYVRIAEMSVARQLGNRESVTFAEACRLIADISQMIGQQVRQTSDLLGIDLATNRPLIASKGHRS
jgi:hypothetical protein